MSRKGCKAAPIHRIKAIHRSRLTPVSMSLTSALANPLRIRAALPACRSPCISASSLRWRIQPSSTDNHQTPG